MAYYDYITKIANFPQMREFIDNFKTHTKYIIRPGYVTHQPTMLHDEA